MSTKKTLLWLVALAALAVGCNKSPRPGGSGQNTPAVSPPQDHLRLALDTLSRFDEYDPQKSMLQAAYHLNRWVPGAGADTPWEPPPLVRRWPAAFRTLPAVADLANLQFTLEDMHFLRESYWMRDLGEWVARLPLPPEFDAWQKALEKMRGEQHAYEVGVAFRLFDWTVRNIQLDPLPPYPVDPAGPAPKPGEPAARSPLERAVAGPGYTAFPWQTLLFGTGDAWQRARVFIRLARQHQLEVVMLAWEDKVSVPRLQPWLPALLVDDQLYLFDTGLGLPIPGPEGAAVATLGQVLQDKNLVRSLDVGQEYEYVPARADLDHLVALIDAEPECLSRRMKLLEESQTQGQPLTLAVDATGLAARLGRCRGLARVELWTVPLETIVYSTALAARMETEPGLLVQKLQRDYVFTGTHPLMQGRQRHFRGVFENADQKDGAKTLYLKARIPDEMIKQLDTSGQVQAGLGIFRGRQNEQEWKAYLLVQKMVAIRFKQNATYWLGLIHCDTGRPEAALDWIKARTLEADDDNPWKSGARYNVARLYEAQGDLEQARKLLLHDSPQKHGNLVRARFLRQKLEAKK